MDSVRKGLNNKGYYVVDADIEKFFDNVNQEKLMVLIEQRISDRRILKLIRQWLKSGIMADGTVVVSDLGTSQGSVISPLLANIYLNVLDRLWGKYGKSLGKLVRYADDSVVICKNKKNADHAYELLRYIMKKLDLTLHPQKTKIVGMWGGKEGFDFLGLHHRKFHKLRKDGKQYIETYQYPSKKAMKKMKLVIKENVNQRYLLPKDVKSLVETMNLKIRGWKNYYKTDNNDKWMNALDFYVLCTFTRWFNKKHSNRSKLGKMKKVRKILTHENLIKFAA